MPPYLIREVNWMPVLQRIACIIAIGFAVIGIGRSAGFAADPPVKIAVVDMEKVNRDAPRMKQYMEDIDRFKKNLLMKLDIRSQNMLLSPADIEELVAKKTLSNPTEQDKNRVKELEGLQEKIDKELKDLEQAKDLNDQQKARLNELRAIRKKSEDTGNALSKDYETQYTNKVQDMDKLAAADLKDAIQKIAVAKGFTVVVVKEAVLLGGTDISDDVINKLDRKAQ